MDITAAEIDSVTNYKARGATCPYCNAPAGQECARKFRYVDGWSWDSGSAAPRYDQYMWHAVHRGRKLAYLLGLMFIITEELELADIT